MKRIHSLGASFLHSKEDRTDLAPLWHERIPSLLSLDLLGRELGRLGDTYSPIRYISAGVSAINRHFRAFEASLRGKHGFHASNAGPMRFLHAFARLPSALGYRGDSPMGGGGGDGVRNTLLHRENDEGHRLLFAWVLQETRNVCAVLLDNDRRGTEERRVVAAEVQARINNSGGGGGASLTRQFQDISYFMTGVAWTRVLSRVSRELGQIQISDEYRAGAADWIAIVAEVAVMPFSDAAVAIGRHVRTLIGVPSHPSSSAYEEKEREQKLDPPQGVEEEAVGRTQVAHWVMDVTKRESIDFFVRSSVSDWIFDCVARALSLTESMTDETREPLDHVLERLCAEDVRRIKAEATLDVALQPMSNIVAKFAHPLLAIFENGFDKIVQGVDFAIHSTWAQAQGKALAEALDMEAELDRQYRAHARAYNPASARSRFRPTVVMPPAAMLAKECRDAVLHILGYMGERDLPAASDLLAAILYDGMRASEAVKSLGSILFSVISVYFSALTLRVSGRLRFEF